MPYGSGFQVAGCHRSLSNDAFLNEAVGDYLKGFAIGLPAWGLMPLVQAGLVTAGNAKQSMYAAIGSAIVFGILAFMGSTGIANMIGLPLGLQVIGWITSISNWVYVILAFLFMNTRSARLRLDQFIQAPVTRQDTMSILRTGVPGSIENIVASVGLNFLLKGLSLSGSNVTHVASVGLRMLELVWLPFWYLSGAVTRFLAGKFNTGCYTQASSALRQVMLIISLPLLLVSLLYLIAPEFMLHVIGRDTSSLEGQQRVVFILTGMYQSVTVMIMSLSAGLRGFTLYTYPMKVQLVVTLLISLPFLFIAQGSVEPSRLIGFFVVVGVAQMVILYYRGSGYLKTSLHTNSSEEQDGSEGAGSGERTAAYFSKKRKGFKS